VNDICSPGSHPHSDQPNWRPAETAGDYLRNCSEGLEVYSERRAAKLLGMSRIGLWRATLMGEIPEELFEFILAEAGKAGIMLSSKSLAQVGLALRTSKNVAEVERCPNCGFVLRVRALVGDRLADIVNEWVRKRDLC
jgi:hypothetical protein